MDFEIMFLLSLFISTAVAGATAYLAHLKGRNPFLWFFFGIMFSFFAPLVLISMDLFEKYQSGLSQQSKSKSSSASSVNGEEGKKDLDQQKINPLAEASWYYLDISHRQMGPVSIIALRELWNRGELDMMSYVWMSGMDQWEKVDHLPELKQLLNRPTDW